MNSFLYTSNKNIKHQGHGPIISSEIELENLLERVFEQKEFLQALCNGFRSVLECNDLKNLVEAIFRLEGQLYKLKEKYPKNSMIEDLSDFYKSLSPMLLRVIWEQAAMQEQESSLLDGLVSSLRVALEEELFYWQERLKSVDN